MTLGASPEPELCGSVIAGKYRLDHLLGEGGMGAVFCAYNLQLEVPVALKLLRAELGGADLAERLRVEARAAAKLVHPSIVRVFDIGETESGHPFIVMELLLGENLTAMIERGPLDPTRAVALLLPIAEALALAHSRGVVHRDLKPDNIFVAREDATLRPKLLDFGIAKVTGTTTRIATLTEQGTIVGSPDYMSPEQAFGQSDIDERSDIWSLCVVLYEAIAGKPPFSGDTHQAVLASVVADTPAPLTSLAKVDHRLAGIIERGLSKERDARYPSMFELGRDLAAWLVEQGVHEDVTGAALETKWLGRSIETRRPESGRAEAESVARSREHATLISVVHPSPLPPRDADTKITIPRQRNWFAFAAVALVAVSLGGSLLISYRLRLSGLVPEPQNSAAAPRARAVEEEAKTPLHTVTTLPIVTLDAIPLEQASGAPPPPPAPAARVPAPSSRHAARSRSKTVPSVQKPTLSTLPEALPARSSQPDLLNPY